MEFEQGIAVKGSRPDSLPSPRESSREVVLIKESRRRPPYIIHQRRPSTAELLHNPPPAVRADYHSSSSSSGQHRFSHARYSRHASHAITRAREPPLRVLVPSIVERDRDGPSNNAWSRNK